VSNTFGSTGIRTRDLLLTAEYSATSSESDVTETIIVQLFNDASVCDQFAYLLSCSAMYLAHIAKSVLGYSFNRLLLFFTLHFFCNLLDKN